jgi:iron complex outermembrane receptor protein
VFLGNRTGFVIRDAAGDVISEIAPLRPEKVDALEVGYKGAIGDKLYIDAVAYQSWYRDFISALTQVANPAAMTPTFATYPDGTPVAAGLPVEGMLSTYLNFGRAQVRGIDVGADYRPIPQVTLSASASVLRLVDFQNDNALQKDLLLNAPTFKLRGSAQVDGLGLENAFARVDGRYHNAHAFESGYWNSMALLGGKLPSRVVVDVTAGYRLPRVGLTVTGTVSDLLDNTTLDVLGAPVPHRFAWLQVAYDIDGLRY